MWQPPCRAPDRSPGSGSYIRLNVAVTATSVFPVTVHGPVPEHPPLQPTNLEPAAGIALSVTIVPAANVALQLHQHARGPEALDMTPEPGPTLLIVRVKVDGTSVDVATVDATTEPHASSEYGEAPKSVYALIR